MLVTQLMQFMSDSMNTIMTQLPAWNADDLDMQKILDLCENIRAWDNWLPLHELMICISIMVALWVTMQAMLALIKGWEIIKP